jgi:hypothetical protein
MGRKYVGDDDVLSGGRSEVSTLEYYAYDFVVKRARPIFICILIGFLNSLVFMLMLVLSPVCFVLFIRMRISSIVRRTQGFWML